MEAHVGHSGSRGRSSSLEASEVVERSCSVGSRYCFPCRRFTEHRLQRVRIEGRRKPDLRVACTACGKARRLDGIDLRDPAVRGSEIMRDSEPAWSTRVRIGVALLVFLLLVLVIVAGW